MRNLIAIKIKSKFSFSRLTDLTFTNNHYTEVQNEFE